MLERLTAISADLAVTVRLEVAVRGPGNAGTEVFERILADLDRLAEGTGDLAVLRSLLGLPPRRHPCSAEDLAGVVNGDLETVQRVLVGMVRQRVAEPGRQ